MEASRVAVTTQVYCDWEPFSDPTICGSATETTVLLIIATNNTTSSPLNERRTSRWSIGAASAGAAVCALTHNLREEGREGRETSSLYIPSMQTCPLGKIYRP
ncbi:hypothetical protein GCM10010405_03850 [Streptomyces macrosporus]|uniref:Uncharacterized protein n=1 Tax=Streptomyces macrosporus TaxID=44032 RepID=A0ABN3JAM7_9ACTN